MGVTSTAGLSETQGAGGAEKGLREAAVDVMRPDYRCDFKEAIRPPWGENKDSVSKTFAAQQAYPILTLGGISGASIL